MKSKKTAVALVLAVAAVGALADDQTIVLTQTGAGMFSGMFSDTHVQSGLFVDTFTFTLPGALSLLGSGALSFASSSGPISLTVATLDAGNGVTVSSPPDPASIAIPSMLSFAGAMAPLTLTVLASAGDPFGDVTSLAASYSGNITFNTAVQAIPEPETYALMLAGLAGVGFASRRREAKRMGVKTA